MHSNRSVLRIETLTTSLIPLAIYPDAVTVLRGMTTVRTLRIAMADRVHTRLKWLPF